MQYNEVVFNFLGGIKNGTIKQNFGQNKKYVILEPTSFELDFLHLVTYDEKFDAIFFSSSVVTPNMEYIGSVRLEKNMDKIDYVFFQEHVIIEYIKYIELFGLKASRETFIEFWLELAPSYMIKVDVADFINQEH